MFDSLQDSLSNAFRRLAGQAKLTESNMREGLQEVRKALLEADVNYKVTQTFIDRVAAKALGENVLKQLRPTELVVKIVYDELVELMGPVDSSLHLKDFTKIMLCGLQGSGKTTTCAKLAMMLKKNGRRPLLVAADLQRPAAIKQLQVLGEQIGVPVIADLNEKDPVALCRRAVKEAKASGANVAIFDTAGRLHIDQELMKQLQSIDEKVEPDQVYLVVDGMTGQDAVNSAQAFNEALELNGVILTKLDGDQRGGAVLSVKEVTGVPVKFLGMGEHIDELEPFSPERMAGRILGQGDLAALAQRVSSVIDEDEQRKMQEELERGEFTLVQFRGMLEQVGKMGPISKLMQMMGGGKEVRDAMANMDSEAQMRRIRGIIDSMTPDERRNPKKYLDTGRRRRIAAGAGVQPNEISDLVKMFEPMADMMKKMNSMGPLAKMRYMRQLQKEAMANPNGQLRREKVGTGKRLSPKEKAKLKKEKEKAMRKQKRQQRND